MAENSLPWGGTQPGDAGPYTDDNWSDMCRELYTSAPASQGPVRGYSDELAVTNPAPTTIRVGAGVGIVDGKFYRNTAGVDFAIQAPVAGTNYYRVVLRKSWAAQTVRAALLGPNPADYPALTQVDSNIWEIPLARVNITSGAAVTVLDDRDWAETALSTSATSLPDAFADNTLDGAKLKDNTVPGGKLMDLGVTGGKIANLTITNGKIAESTIAGSKLVPLTVTATQIANNTITMTQLATRWEHGLIPFQSAYNTTDAAIIVPSSGMVLMPADKESVVYSNYFQLPDSYCGTLTVNPILSWASSDPGMAFRIEYTLWWSDIGEMRNSHQVGQITEDCNAGNMGQAALYAFTGLSTNDPFTRSLLFMQIRRFGLHANDNLNEGVYCHGFSYQFLSK